MGYIDRGSHLEAGAGTRRDFAEVFREEFPRLAGYCTGLVGNRDAGADLAQEALARTWSRWMRVSNPRAYSYLVATNLARRHWKSLAREKHALSDLAAQARGATTVDPSVRDLVERLPGRLRSATVLHYYADLPVAEIARLLHRPQGTIRQRLHEARRLLAVEIERQERS